VALAPSTSLAPTSYRAVAGAGLLHDALRGVSGSIGLRFGGR
jgi:hypothetical protein